MSPLTPPRRSISRDGLWAMDALTKLNALGERCSSKTTLPHMSMTFGGDRENIHHNQDNCTKPPAWSILMPNLAKLFEQAFREKWVFL